MMFAPVGVRLRKSLRVQAGVASAARSRGTAPENGRADDLGNGSGRAPPDVVGLREREERGASKLAVTVTAPSESGSVLCRPLALANEARDEEHRQDADWDVHEEDPLPPPRTGCTPRVARRWQHRTGDRAEDPEGLFLRSLPRMSRTRSRRRMEQRRAGESLQGALPPDRRRG